MANNITVLDSVGASQTVKTTDTAGVHTPHHNVDSSALPSGASTSAKQPALGTAGTASADVITIQGITSMTPVLVTLSGTNNVATVTTVSTVTTCSTVTTLTTLTGGGVAHDGADSGNPVKVGARCLSAPSTATMVADADRIDLTGDKDGALFVRTVALGDVISTSQSVTDTTSTAATGFSAVASTKNHITQITVWNSSATATFVKIQDGSGGTTLYVVPAPAGGGAVLHFDPPLRQATANTALYFAANASASTVYVSITGFRSKV